MAPMRLEQASIEAALSDRPGAPEALLRALTGVVLARLRRGGAPPPPEAFRGRLRGGFVQPEHKLLIQVRGKHELRLPGALLVMQAGDAVAVPGGVEHRERALRGGGGHCHVLVLPQGEGVYWHVAEVSLAAHRVVRFASRRHAAADGAMLGDLLRLLCAPSSAPAATQSALRRDLLAGAMRLVEALPGHAAAAPRGGDPRIVACDALIRRRFADPALRVSTLARELGVHPNHLSQRYREITGLNLRHVIARTRIAHACALLTQTLDPIAQVAVRCGYRDRRSFTRAFARLRQVAPEHFRRFAQHGG